MSNKLKIVELFAGVGGFRLGLGKFGHKTVWANQWEPKTKVQHAYDCYVKNFGDYKNLNTDIFKVKNSEIPKHNLLVGGFPCQDYSVATVSAKGIQGKKGVLWWEINRIVKSKKPELILLENVDRLLRSPVNQRGRDFGVMLSCLSDAGYIVEWRVINAADYGFPQKRRRVFIFGAKKNSSWGKYMIKSISDSYLTDKGFFSKEFPTTSTNNSPSLFNDFFDKTLEKNIENISKNFEYHFLNGGIMVDRKIHTIKLEPIKEKVFPLKKVLIKGADKSYYIPKKDVKKWKELKGAKKKIKINK